MSVLHAESISVRLGGRVVVEHASLTLRGGELTALVGPNGAGKTTLVRALTGLLAAQGRIWLDDQLLGDVTTTERARRIAYLPQGHTFHWPLAVESVVALGRDPYADPFSRQTDADRAAIARALAATGITELAHRPVTALSGGERARVALARALATEASILLADEPTISLDPRHQLIVMGLLRDAARRGAAVMAVLHDLALAARFADRVAVMHRGRIVADATPPGALTTERLADIFQVEAMLVDTPDGRIPLLRNPLS